MVLDFVLRIFLCCGTVSAISNSIRHPEDFDGRGHGTWEVLAMLQLVCAVSLVEIKPLLVGRDQPHEADDSTEAKAK